MSTPELSPWLSKWRPLLAHPVTVGGVIWAFIPLGLVLLWLNPALRKDRRWWAAVAVWGLYLLWAGRLPFIGSRNDTSRSGASVASVDAGGNAEEAASSNPYFPSDAKTRKERNAADKAFSTLLSEADALWQKSDSRPEAVEKYVFLLDTYCGYGKGMVNSDVGKAHQAELTRVAARAIDSLVESGNVAAAKKLIIAVDQQHLTPVYRNPKSDALVPKARSEKNKEDRELDKELERMERQQTSGYSSQEQRTPTPEHTVPDTHEEKLTRLVKQVRPGMSMEQVVSLLGEPDRTSVEDLGDLNPAKQGQEHTLLTWDSPQNEASTILLSFVNNRLTDGGTVGGYSITKGGRRVPVN